MDVEIIQPLLIIVLILGSPVWVTLAIVAVVKIIGKFCTLVANLFKKD